MGKQGSAFLEPEKWFAYFKNISDIYALALQCDLVRFGSVTFQSAGERVNFTKPWTFNGTKYEFNDTNDHHEYWHNYRAGGEIDPKKGGAGNKSNNSNVNMARHALFINANIAYFLSRLADPDMPTASGKTWLDDNMVHVTSEFAYNHVVSNIPNYISGAGGRFKVGVIEHGKMNAEDFYNTILKGFGLDTKVGLEQYRTGLKNNVLA